MSVDADEAATLPQAFARAARRHPDKPLLHFEGEAFGYGALERRVRLVARILRGWGLERGNRVAFYLGNSPTFVVAYLGVLASGGVVVPVNTRYRESELRHMLEDSGARLALTDEAGRGELEKVVRGVVVERLLVLPEQPGEAEAAWRDLAPPADGPDDAVVTADDLAVIGYTSGTTGRSKGAMLSHGNFIANSRAVTRAWRWTADDHLLLVLPLFHMHGLGVGLHGTLVQGSTLTLRRAFDAEQVYGDLLSGRVTMFFGVPTLYHRLLAVAEGAPGRALPDRVRLLVSGSAPLSPRTHAEVEARLGRTILERYGMTETIMNLGNPFDGPRKAGTVGVPFDGVEVRIAGPDDAPLADGEVGEIQLRGPNVSRGYWRRPDATAATRSDDGWFRTGDLGFRDESGHITLSGRAKELIISGGFNVYPREVEEVIAELPEVDEVAVLGLPHPDLGEQVVAAVVGTVEDEVLLEHCRRRMAGFKKPRLVVRLDALPRNALGKVQKHLLAQELTALAGAGKGRR